MPPVLGASWPSSPAVPPPPAPGPVAGVLGSSACRASAVAVSIADAIEGFDLREFRIDGLELLAQPLDVAVDRPVVDIDVLAIGRIHQLVAVFDMAEALRQRFQNQELGHRQLDRPAAPRA